MSELVTASMTSPLRADLAWTDRWEGPDGGLIAAWEAGRELAGRNPELATLARAGHLVALPWKGGVDKVPKDGKKTGALLYVAMWHGLRGDDLAMCLHEAVQLVDARTGTLVTFTDDLGVIGKDEEETLKAAQRRSSV